MFEIKKCITCGLKQPSYNLDSAKIAEYCANCKTDGMKNFKANNCIKCSEKVASYNFPGEKKRLYCIDCKDPKMQNLKYKTCMNENCLTQVCSSKFDGYCQKCYLNFNKNLI